MPKGDNQSDRSASSLAAQRRRVAEEYIGEIQALADCMVGVLGTDLIRAKLGRERALRVLRLAGRDADRIGGDWERSEPAMRQISVGGPGGDYGGDPRHDPAVVKAILAGAPHAEVNKLIDEATARCEQRAKERHARNATGLAPGAAQGFPDTGLPAVPSETRLVRDPQTGQLQARPAGTQRSVDYATWEELQGRDGPPPDRALTANRLSPAFPAGGPVNGHGATASVTECDHEGQPGKFCARCGMRLRAPMAAAAAEAST
jgi:hypothetical protein